MKDSSAGKKRPGTSKTRNSREASGEAGSEDTARSGGAKEVKLLSGGNPQIPKGDGDGPVQDYIAAMPGWKHDIGRHLDDLVTSTLPDVRKAVRWNSPFYGLEGQGWFLSFHCFTKYVKVTFLRGGSLDPRPPGVSKYEEVRYLDVREDEPIDEEQFVSWVRQAAELPGDHFI